MHAAKFIFWRWNHISFILKLGGMIVSFPIRGVEGGVGGRNLFSFSFSWELFSSFLETGGVTGYWLCLLSMWLCSPNLSSSCFRRSPWVLKDLKEELYYWHAKSKSQIHSKFYQYCSWTRRWDEPKEEQDRTFFKVKLYSEDFSVSLCPFS